MVCFRVNNVPRRSLLDYYKASSRSPTLSPSSSKVSSQKPHSSHALVCSVNLSWLFIAWRMEPQIPPDVTQGSWNLPQSFFFPQHPSGAPYFSQVCTVAGLTLLCVSCWTILPQPHFLLQPLSSGRHPLRSPAGQTLPSAPPQSFAFL